MCKTCDTGFGHLHLHTEYSTLDGAARVEELVRNAKELGQEFVAITDHGSTSGLWEAQKAGDKHGVKVIFGTEFYYERENDGKNGHLVALAKNNTGLRNLFKLQEYAYVHNYYYKPRINFDILKVYSEGLIVTSSCLGSTFNQYLIEGDVASATAWARKFKEVFRDDFYIELQPNQIPEQHIANMSAIRIARQLGIKLVATNDVHYTHESDCFPHEVLLALQLNNKMSDEKRFKFDTNDFWMKSEEEMFQTFSLLPHDVVLEAMSNTKHIADKCDARIEKGNYLPQYYDVPKGMTETEVLRELVLSGAELKGFLEDEPFMKEVQNELDCIDRNGFSGYFLVVADYVQSAKNNGIIVGDRGSVGGSKVAFLTDISTVNPAEYGLLFERFLSDGRTPDIDADFSDQDAVFTDLQKKYGMENVARVIAFGTLSPKSVTRKVLNAFEHAMPEIGKITKLISDDAKTMQDAYSASEELVKLREKYKTEFDVIERLEGIVSHESKHAGGVIVYPDLSSHLPLKTDSKDKTKRIVAWDKYMLEELGHYKFDVLGLETLPILKRCLDSIEEHTGKKINLESIDYEDQNVYDMLCEGDVSGVFQLEAQAAKVAQQRPRCFRDIIAINALIRPGTGDWEEYIARRNGKEWRRDQNRPWMHETMGVMTYQEQFLLDAHHLAGWSVAFADKKIRKHKNIKEDKELANQFMEDCGAIGILKDPQDACDIWDEICAATGDYSFNKSHAATYGKRSFQTAWLKYYYPAHFFASLMSSQKTDGDGQEEIAKYVAEAKKRGVKLLPPDINNSGDVYSVGQNCINYQITTIKHVGESAIAHIFELRPVLSFDDFLQRRNKSIVKQNVIVNLIKAGCFDFDEPNRAELLWRVDMANRTKTQIKRGEETPRYAWNDKMKMQWEKEVLGMYISSHPMEKYSFKPFDLYKEGDDALVGGEVLSVDLRNDKSGKQMAFANLETLHGVVRVLVFSSLWAREQIRFNIAPGFIIMVRGKKSGDAVLLNSVEVLE